jgi:hypothetical protein
MIGRVFGNPFSDRQGCRDRPSPVNRPDGIGAMPAAEARHIAVRRFARSEIADEFACVDV